MFAYAARRMLLSVPVLLVASFLVFVLVAVSGSPTDPLRAVNPPVPEETIRLEERRLGWDQPLLQRYGSWLWGLVTRGDFGPSVNPREDINAEIVTRMGVTLRLVAVAMLVALVIAVVAGVVSAVRQYSALDYGITFSGFLFLAMPSFWLAVLLKEAGIWINGLDGDPRTQLLFTIGDRSPYLADPTWWNRFVDVAGHMILPTISLALISFAAWSRFQRAAMLEVLGSDYVRLARAKGLPARRVLTRHALRTALIPLTTVTAMDLAGILGGAVITETVFQWQGMGAYLIDSITTRDLYAVMAWLTISGLLVVVGNLVADLLYGVLDPRIRHA
ncbi:ABC transporter permease [Pilimelia columellifera]|uniref:ABC transporter permease n=1 Tax=Pilimelia columellifera subsp. columellifera TaxID=706583 RepID=A0ABN3NNJ8_9ACTN